MSDNIKGWLSIGLIVLAVIGVGAWVKASWFDSGNFLTTSSHKPDEVWRMEAAGADARVYEYRSKIDPNVLCITWAGTDKAAGDCVYIPPKP